MKLPTKRIGKQLTNLALAQVSGGLNPQPLPPAPPPHPPSLPPGSGTIIAYYPPDPI